ncbi:hypothetical protein DACRYDRAFT_119868 [Dacryopinax primogenitus]|uniref:Uncharacterized protein n=1 Tax=Dacryopinax primogenitus (strain DJM 731) TaxID=1858805 RepID=M5FZ83_DACPD|nr:uncharacterized protein DACRYDRAFT_119868 [Dacryopinax primogenitus]EJT96807.1 hypothetical protein DACRYDRAFT_119868 [Dacryopinax primogenitus]
MDTFTPYNLSLPSSSPTFIYQPFRDRWCGLQGDPAGGWRSSYPDVATWANGGLNNAGIGVPFRETYLDGANVTLQFEGTAIYLCLTPTGVSFDFLVDGNQVSTSGPAMDPACAETGAELMAYTDGLTYGSHTATMRVNSQGNTDFLFFGGIITIGLNGTDPTPRLVDDTVVGWSYEPSSAWAHSADSGTSDHTSLSYTCSYGPSYTASYSFNGSSAVQLLGLLEVNIDPYTIVLDGQSYQFNGSDLWRQSQQVLFFKGGLDASKQYTITLINYDQSAPDAQQPIGPDFYPCASVQALLLTQVTAIPPSISTARPAASGSLPIEAIIGGAGWRSSYSNVTTWPNAGLGNVGTGIPLRETYLDKANVSVQFEGTAIYLCFTPTGAAYTFSVDGNPVSTIGEVTDPACDDTGANTMAYVDGLSYGSHTGTLRVNSEGNTDFLFFGGVVTVGLNGTNPVSERIDDSDTRWSYEPQNSWTYQNTSGTNDNSTLSWTCSYGPSYTASFIFNGSSAVQMLGLLDLNIGPYTVQLDDQSYQFNGSDFWRESQQVLFFKGGLDASKQYTITLINYDQSAPDAQQPIGPDFYPCASVQALLLTKVTPGLPSPSTSGASPSGTSGGGSGNNSSGAGTGNNTSGSNTDSSSPVGAIVGGVVGGIAGLCIIGFPLWFVWWRGRREAASQRDMSEIQPYQLPAGHSGRSFILPQQQPLLGTDDEAPQKPEEAPLEGYTYAQNPGTSIFLSSDTSQSFSRDEKRRRPNMSREPRPLPTDASVSPPMTAPTSPPQLSTNPSSDRGDIHIASTQELVGILNRRLREQYRTENDLDLPEYEPVD